MLSHLDYGFVLVFFPSLVIIFCFMVGPLIISIGVYTYTGLMFKFSASDG